MSAGALVAVAGAVSATLASCAQTPTNVPVQTMEQPKDVAVVCMQVLDSNLNPIPPIPVQQSNCAPVPPGYSGAALPYHLFALVTQTTRGELAVVDLTAGVVVDEDPGTPGVNFLPVGRLPTDVTVTPDGLMAFVGSGSPNAPAIYGLPSPLLLGDSQGLDGGAAPTIADLTTWPACALPQAPGALAVLPRAALLPAASDAGAPAVSDAAVQADVETSDAGASDAEATDAETDAEVPDAQEDAAVSDAQTDAGAPDAAASSAELPYVLVAVLPGDSVNGAKVVTIRPEPFLRGAAAAYAASNIDAGVGPGPSVAPASLTPCPIIQYISLSPPPSSAPPQTQAWDDGLRYVDGAVPSDLPANALTCSGSRVPEAGVQAPLGAPRGGATVLDTSGQRPILYVADNALPLIHVVDLSDPAQPKELSPLLALSAADPRRTVGVRTIAVSPTTRDYRRYLYAVDRDEGSIMVYDITDPVGGPRVPLLRPHPEIQPFQPVDRISFGSPVAAVAFVSHDWQLQTVGNSTISAALPALLCNPNRNIDVPISDAGTIDNGPFTDFGGYYRSSASPVQNAILGPARLRGIFAFATLSTGNIEIIDVDDWDAPCRRPDPLGARGTLDAGIGETVADLLLDSDYGFSAIAPPQPPPDPYATDPDPYHAPLTFRADNTQSPVSDEWYFPVSAPHRARSFYLLRNDTVNGSHAPYLLAAPQLYLVGAPVATSGTSAFTSPNIVRTDTLYVDPSLQANPTAADPTTRGFIIPGTVQTAGVDAGAADAGTDASDAGGVDAATLVTSLSTPFSVAGVRFAWEDPQVQADQDWAVTYEGTLPGFFDGNGNALVQADVIADPGFQTATLVNANAHFCQKGIEDFALGQQRAGTAISGALGELAAKGLPAIPNYANRVADYVQITDNILDPSDGYWSVPNACWTDAEPVSGGGFVTPAPTDRAQLCDTVFGQTLDPTTPSTQRDYPILEAYDGVLRIGRFAQAPPAAPAVDGGVPPPAPPRVVIGADPSNVPSLRLLQCCFHNQVHFNVRTGGEWRAFGTVSGFLNHIVAAGTGGRCEPSCDARDSLLNARAIPVPRPASTSGCMAPSPTVDRDSLIAMRNPMFSFLVWNGQDPQSCADIAPVRDMEWRFTTRGQFVPYGINLAATTTALSPQSMLFIDSLEQLALVDGESQGLILIDLNLVAEAHAPYF